MMSNGPCQVFRLFHRWLPLDDGRFDLLRRSEHEHVTEALALRGRGASGRNCCACWRIDVRPEIDGRGGVGSARGRALRKIQDDGHRAGNETRGRVSTSGLRDSGWTFVASTTVSLPAASRLRQ
jgi:hypothetical protein